MWTFSEISEATGGKWLNDINLNGDITINAIVTDSRRDCSNSLFLALEGDNFDGHEFINDAIVQNAVALCINHSALKTIPCLPDIPIIAVADTLHAYQQLAAFHKRRFSDLLTIAVTGSMGKTSTKEIIRAILIEEFGADAVYASAGNTNNQIGVPLNLLQLRDEHRVCVIEIGTNHHGEVEPLSRISQPDIAVITSIGPCHLEHLGSLAGVAKEKSRIFSGLKKHGTAVFPFLSPELAILEQAADDFLQIRFGSAESDAAVKVKYINGDLHGSQIEIYLPEEKPFTVIWPLTGAHQAMNAAAAIAATLPLNISKTAISNGLKNCALPGMRMKISEANGITWLNDAYNASPGSMMAVLEWLAEFADQDKLCLVLGDMLELGLHSDVAHLDILKFTLALFPNSTILGVGQAMSNAVREISSGKKTNISFYPDAVAAATAIKKHLTPGMTVLLKGSRGIHLEKVLS